MAFRSLRDRLLEETRRRAPTGDSTLIDDRPVTAQPTQPPPGQAPPPTGFVPEQPKPEDGQIVSAPAPTDYTKVGQYVNRVANPDMAKLNAPDSPKYKMLAALSHFDPAQGVGQAGLIDALNTLGIGTFGLTGDGDKLSIAGGPADWETDFTDAILKFSGEGADPMWGHQPYGDRWDAYQRQQGTGSPTLGGGPLSSSLSALALGNSGTPVGPFPAPSGPAPTGPSGPANPLGDLFQQTLMKILGQGEVDANDPAIQNVLNAARTSGTRADDRERAFLAERAAKEGFSDSGGFDTQAQGILQRRGEYEAGLSADLVQEAQVQRMGQIMAALQMAGNRITEQERQALQKELGELDAAVRREGYSTQRSIASEDSALRRYLGDRGFDLDWARLGSDNAQFTADLNQRAMIALLGGL